MTQTRLTLDSHCIVVNNAGKADDITARRHSLTFHQVVTDAVPGYVKLFESLKPTSKEGKAKIKTYIDQVRICLISTRRYKICVPKLHSFLLEYPCQSGLYGKDLRVVPSEK